MSWKAIADMLLNVVTIFTVYVIEDLGKLEFVIG